MPPPGLRLPEDPPARRHPRPHRRRLFRPCAEPPVADALLLDGSEPVAVGAAWVDLDTLKMRSMVPHGNVSSCAARDDQTGTVAPIGCPGQRWTQRWPSVLLLDESCEVPTKRAIRCGRTPDTSQAPCSDRLGTMDPGPGPARRDLPGSSRSDGHRSAPDEHDLREVGLRGESSFHGVGGQTRTPSTRDPWEAWLVTG